MRNMLKIAEGIDVVPLLNALAINDDLWNANALRTTYPNSPHKDCDDIWVFFNATTDDPLDTVNDIQTVPFPAWSRLPQLRPIIFDLMRRVEGVQLGRVIITRLPPGKSIAPHCDQGAPADYYSRYQVALQSLPGATIKIGGEVINFRMGECWLIDNSVEHAVTNNSADDRIVVIIDIRSGTC